MPWLGRRRARILTLGRFVSTLLVVFSFCVCDGAGLSAQEPPPAPATPIAPTSMVTASLDATEFAVATLPGIAGPLFSLDPLAERLGLLMTKDPMGEGRILEAGTMRIALQSGSAVVTLGREIVTMSQPAVQQGGFFFVPFDLLERLLSEVVGLAISWRPAENRLVLGRDAQRTIEIAIDRFHVQGVTTLVVRPLDGAIARYRVARGADDALEIVFPAQRLLLATAASALTTTDEPFLRRLSVQPDRLRLDLVPGTAIHHYELREPFRVVVDLHAGAAPFDPLDPRGTGDGASPGTGGIDLSTILRPHPRATGLQTIVIDPGHGGRESGAVGPGGRAEKSLTLELARRLQNRLAARLPARIVLTRTDDSTLSTTERSAIANQYRADLFVSIHLNSSTGTSAHGAETYFLSLQASDERAASSALTENATPESASGSQSESGSGMDPDLELLFWDLAQGRHLARSQRVAMLIQEELNLALGLRDRGVKQAPFRVLMGANMPAVLVELGFLSNPEEETRLADAAYQDQLVDALVRAVLRFRSELEPSAAGSDRLSPPGAPPS